MKRQVVCHYKNGSLLFCTVGSYKREKACQILEVFTSQKLTSAVQPVGDDLFRIVGRLNLHYDPFIDSDIKWNDVLLKMNSIMSYLEENIGVSFQNKTFKLEAKYIVGKSK